MSSSQIPNIEDRKGPFTDEQALTWLLARSDGRMETTISNLARQWDWNRSMAASALRSSSPEVCRLR